MKKLIPLAFMSIVVMVSCNRPEVQDKMLHFQNEIFSMDYPSSWEYDEEWENMCDSFPSSTQGYRLELYSPSMTWPVVTIQRTSIPGCFDTPEAWRDANILFSQFNGLLGVVEDLFLDSASFDGFPAALGVCVIEEEGDTLVQKQIVVKVENNVYFLNNLFQINDKNNRQELLGDSIIETIRFNRP